MICCLSTKTSASSAARDRNRSTTKPKISVQRSHIQRRIIRFSADCQPDQIYDRDSRYDEQEGRASRLSKCQKYDQVDSVTQALSWIGQRRQNRIACVAPIIVSRPRTYFGDNPNCF
jgi:hypothetical protein